MKVTMRVQITAKYGYTWRLQYCFKNGPLTENGNSAKKRAGNETAASPANGNGNGKPEFENGATLVAITETVVHNLLGNKCCIIG